MRRITIPSWILKRSDEPKKGSIVVMGKVFATCFSHLLNRYDRYLASCFPPDGMLRPHDTERLKGHPNLPVAEGFWERLCWAYHTHSQPVSASDNEPLQHEADSAKALLMQRELNLMFPGISSAPQRQNDPITTSRFVLRPASSPRKGKSSSSTSSRQSRLSWSLYVGERGRGVTQYSSLYDCCLPWYIVSDFVITVALRTLMFAVLMLRKRM
jgi:hypothetical protein